MIQSMTGFASAERQLPDGRLSWEIRSVNHRYLEISLRLPEEFRVLEPAIREQLGNQLGRGKIDAGLRFSRDNNNNEGDLVLNTALAQQIITLHAELAKLSGMRQEASLDALLRWPGVVSERQQDSESLQKLALEALAEATSGLRDARGREGQKLVSVIEDRLEQVAKLVSQVREWLPDIREGLKNKLLTRLADLPQPLDPGRLEQEVAFLVQKIDVDEELDRLDAHVSEARRVLKLDEPVGRRLDFLMQEFNRESNTLSSKSIDNRSTQASVELKVLIEQMREQVQNIE
ncbi:MAG TPA: YicC/YloC family endoribonuclease [Xanthomonadales bacterium]|nr:YicC/YloC family endoribonuclease [Xanthomonadales bacterium]